MTSNRMPAELLNELFGSLPLENAFGLLTKMPNGLLARNVQKMIKGIKQAMKNNKLNAEDCGPKLEISDDGLTVKHSGSNGANCVRTILPIPKLNGIKKRIIFFYFEMQILNKLTPNYSNEIGFCDPQFPLEGKSLGWYKNSIGTWDKRTIWIDGSYSCNFENVNREFEKEDVIDLGIIQRPNFERIFFATFNGKLLGMVQLPSKFANVQFFPALSMWSGWTSNRMNFGKEQWQFKEFDRILE